MKRFLAIPMMALTILAVSCGKEEPAWKPGTINGSGNGSGTGTEQVAKADYSKLTAQNHPRVMLTKTDEQTIKSRLEAGSDENLARIHSIILNYADNYLKSSALTYKLEGRRLLSVCTEASSRIVCLSYAYRMTGDKKYLDKAVENLEAVCAFKDWNAPSHFLDGAEMALGVGIGYDWLYDGLSSELKSKIVTAIDKFAFYNALNKKWNLNFYESTSNWNQVCNGGLVVAALATFEECKTDARSIIDKAVESNPGKVEEMYNPDGNYPEGYGYWSYGSTFECMMLSAMETCLGTDFGINLIPGWNKTGKWIMFMENVNRRCFNYCDCDTTSDAMPSLWYMAYRFKDPSLLYIELMKLKDGRYTSSGVQRYLPLVVTYASKFELGKISAPEEHVWSGNGINPVALVHGDWSFTESDVILGIKGGVCNNSHGHMDVGSFCFDADGINWSVDLGLQSYSTIEGVLANMGGNFGDYGQNSMRWDVFRYNNFNHSTLTINGAKHRAAGKGVFKEIIDKADSKGAVLDMSSCVSDQCQSAIRTITVDGGNTLVVKDVVGAKTLSSAKVRWTMVTTAIPEIKSDGIVLYKDGKTRYLKVTSTEAKVTYKTWSTEGQSYDASNQGYYECGFEATVTSGHTNTFTTTLSTKN